MATPLPNAFQQWELSLEETLGGSILTDLQQKVLQNELALVAQEKLQLLFDSSNTILFAQKEAELQGKLGILQYLLDKSVTSTQQLYQEASSTQS